MNLLLSVIRLKKEIYHWTGNSYIEPDWENSLGQLTVFGELVGEGLYKSKQDKGETQCR